MGHDVKIIQKSGSLATEVFVDGNKIERCCGYRISQYPNQPPKISIDVIGEITAELEGDVTIHQHFHGDYNG